jgi:hypothetical protein
VSISSQFILFLSRLSYSFCPASRNLTNPKTLPTIWYTYITLVIKYQISAINSYWEKCDEKYLGWTEGRTDGVFIHIEYIYTFSVTFFSATIDGRNLIFGHKLHIGTPYRGKRFLTCQIPTSCLPKSGGIISTDRGKTVYPSPLSGSGGIKIQKNNGVSALFDVCNNCIFNNSSQA